jgi:hypothetical protein
MGLFKLLTDPGNFQFYWQNQKPGSESPNIINPRKIPFGKDRFKGGSSKEPYIIKSPTFADDDTKSAPFYNDFILRGGILAPLSAADDVVRLTKYFADLNNPKGALFVAKQNLLSRTGVKTEATKGFAYLGSAVNEGYYNPLSTLTQAGSGFLGIHVNKQGGLFNDTSLKKYQDVIAERILTYDSYSKKHIADRLTNLQYLILNPPTTPFTNYDGVNKYSTYPNESTLIQYSGGPGSVVGVGSTSIKFATNNAGTVLKSLLNPSSNTDGNKDISSTSLFKTWDAKTINSQKTNLDSLIKEDFRKVLTPEKVYQNSFLSKSPDYVTKNIEDKLGLNNPGSRLRDRSNYSVGSVYNGNSTALDKVNASYIYKSDSVDGSRYGKDPNYNDLIQFNIAILNNELQKGGPYKKYMHFRAFIDNISDSYNADWNAINYMGRAEKFYKYKGFDRKMSLAFTVAAQSKQEITAMYDKLNFLASSLSPEYLDSISAGYMAGNIAYITLGGYIDDQPGIITSLEYTIPEESPWEIAIDENGDKANPMDVRQLPHIIRVSLQFTPIHKFRPEKQSFEDDSDKNSKGKITGNNSVRLKTPGMQKYIDQNRPSTSNYDEQGKFNSIPSPTNTPIQANQNTGNLVQQ